MSVLDFLSNLLQIKREISMKAKVILTETYSEPNQTSKKEYFTETVNGFQTLINLKKVST